MTTVNDLRLIAANAQSGVVSLTGDQLTTLLNYVASVAANSGGTGLAVTGLDNGATVQDQVFQNGVTLGINNGTNGTLKLYNNDTAGYVEVLSDADKALKFDNTGHDVQVGINTSPVSGVALAVSNNTQLGLGGLYTQGLAGVDLANKVAWIGDKVGDNNSTRQVIDDTAQTILMTAVNLIEANTSDAFRVNGTTNGSLIEMDDTAQTISLNAANGVSTSAGLTVGGGALKVPVYTNGSDRDTAIPAPEEGMIVYVTSLGAFQGWQGSAWAKLN